MTTMKPRALKLARIGKYQRLLGGPPETAGMKSGLVMLDRGESVGEHSTGNREEAIVVLQGKAQVTAGGKPLPAVEAPGFVYIPRGTPHDVANAGAATLKYIYVVSPA